MEIINLHELHTLKGIVRIHDCVEDRYIRDEHC